MKESIAETGLRIAKQELKKESPDVQVAAIVGQDAQGTFYTGVAVKVGQNWQFDTMLEKELNAKRPGWKIQVVYSK